MLKGTEKGSAIHASAPGQSCLSSYPRAGANNQILITSKYFADHTTTEAGRGPLEVSCPTLFSKHVQSEEVAQGHVLVSSESL